MPRINVSDEIEPDFCPRLRWSVENGEDLSLILMERRTFDTDMKVLAFMEKGPTTLLEMEKALGIPKKSLFPHMKRLQKRGIQIERTKGKFTESTTYRILSRPKIIRFHHSY